MRCAQEVCELWDGAGCPCAVFDLEPQTVECGCRQTFTSRAEMLNHAEFCDDHKGPGGTR